MLECCDLNSSELRTQAELKKGIASATDDVDSYTETVS